jgi:hypothetical protein
VKEIAKRCKLQFNAKAMGETITKYRVCKIANTNAIGGVTTYDLVSTDQSDFDNDDIARKWIDNLEDIHKYGEYVILEVFKRT